MHLGKKINLTYGLLFTTVISSIVVAPESVYSAEAQQLEAMRKKREEVATRSAAMQRASQGTYKNMMANTLAQFNDAASPLSTALADIVNGRNGFPAPNPADAAHAQAHGTTQERYDLLKRIERTPVGGTANDDAAKSGIRRALGIDDSLANLRTTHPAVQAFIKATIFPFITVKAENLQYYRNALMNPLAELAKAGANKLGAVLAAASATPGTAAYNKIPGAGTAEEKRAGTLVALRAIEAAPAGAPNDAIKQEISTALGLGNQLDAATRAKVALFIKFASQAQFLWAFTHINDVFNHHIQGILVHAHGNPNSAANVLAAPNTRANEHAAIVAIAGGAHVDDQNYLHQLYFAVGLNRGGGADQDELFTGFLEAARP